MIQEGLLPCNELLGCFTGTSSKTKDEIPSAVKLHHVPNGNC